GLPAGGLKPQQDDGRSLPHRRGSLEAGQGRGTGGCVFPPAAEPGREESGRVPEDPLPVRAVPELPGRVRQVYAGGHYRVPGYLEPVPGRRKEMEDLGGLGAYIVRYNHTIEEAQKNRE